MHTIDVLSRSVLMSEIIGMVLLSLVLLSLNDYLTLPAPLSSPLACVVMISLGVLLAFPAAVALVWHVAQLLVPQLMFCTPGDLTNSDRDKKNDSSY